MAKKNQKKSYVDDVNGVCYGKLNLYRRRDGSYSGIKKHCDGCRIQEACISASREQREHAESQLQNLSFEDGLKSDADDRYDDDGAPVINPVEQEIDMEAILSENKKSGNKKDFYMILLKRYATDGTDIDMLYPAFREVVSQFLYEFVHMPKKITVEAGRVVSDMNQSELARRENITRQAVSAAMKTETMKFMDKPEGLPKKLSGLEKAVYALMTDGFSIRECAKRLEISKSKVFRVGQLIASKIANFGTVKNSHRKKIQKKSRRTKSQIMRDKKRQTEADAKAWREFQKNMKRR